jgi:hypothetical protein
MTNSEGKSSNKLNNYIEKINSLNENNSNNINTNNLSNKNVSFNYNIPSNYDSKRSINTNVNNNNNNSDNLNAKENQKQNYSMQSMNNKYQNFKNFIKVREILTNFITSALREYNEDEFHYLKIDIFTIFSYLLLPSMENLQNKTEKKKIEIIEQMKFILDKEKDSISYGNFLYLPDKIEINKKKFQINNAYDGANLKNIKSGNNIYNKDKKENNNKSDIENKKLDDNYNIFESLLSITFEEDNNCPLILKNENEALYDILSMYSSNIEVELNKILLYKNYQLALEMSINGIKFVEYNSINFDTLINHLDPFMELIINRLNLILLST